MYNYYEMFEMLDSLHERYGKSQSRSKVGFVLNIEDSLDDDIAKMLSFFLQPISKFLIVFDLLAQKLMIDSCKSFCEKVFPFKDERVNTVLIFISSNMHGIYI